MMWIPLNPRYGTPKPGDLIAIDHADYRYKAWRMADLCERGDGRWSMVLREPDAPDLASSDKHHVGLRRWPASGVWRLRERYALCSCCGDLMPCRHEMADRAVTASAERAARYETSGVCPSCCEPISDRQKSVTIDTNLYVPLGPPVTFHTRSGCRASLISYEAAVAKREGRQAKLSCAGMIVRHSAPDVPDSCSNPECPGGAAWHGSYDNTCIAHSACDLCAPPPPANPTPERARQIRQQAKENR